MPPANVIWPSRARTTWRSRSPTMLCRCSAVTATFATTPSRCGCAMRAVWRRWREWPSYEGRNGGTMPEMILTEQRGRVAIVTLNRPQVMNAMHPTMLSELYDQVRAWNQDKSVGVVVVTGAGKGFCAGADMSAWSLGDGPGAPERRSVDYEEWL